jgi:hypothetical protein
VNNCLCFVIINQFLMNLPIHCNVYFIYSLKYAIVKSILMYIAYAFVVSALNFVHAGNSVLSQMQSIQ